MIIVGHGGTPSHAITPNPRSAAIIVSVGWVGPARNRAARRPTRRLVPGARARPGAVPRRTDKRPASPASGATRLGP